MPENAQKPVDKMGFQIGVSTKGKANPKAAVGVWWIVNLR